VLTTVTFTDCQEKGGEERSAEETPDESTAGENGRGIRAGENYCCFSAARNSGSDWTLK
jgi:hypothetical protein